MILNLEFVGLVALTVGLTQVIKNLRIPARLVPVISLVVGVILALAMKIGDSVVLSVLTGLVIGLSACGLYDTGKKSVLNK